MRNLRSKRASFWSALFFVCVAAAGPGCKNKDELRALTPPSGTEEFTSNFAVAFDDQYTATPLRMEGRAPNDVKDQRLFHARLGHADMVMLVQVERVWGEALYEGRELGDWDQYLEVKLGNVLMGELGKNVAPSQLIGVRGEPLPATLEGQTLLLFLKWAPGEQPAFHHHLMPPEKDAIALIKAMVEHATAEGVIGGRTEKNKARRARRQRKADAPETQEDAK